jgi:hypothetical protein
MSIPHQYPPIQRWTTAAARRPPRRRVFRLRELARSGRQAVVDGAQVDGGLEVPPPSFGFVEALVALGDVGGGEALVAGAQEELAVEVVVRVREPHPNRRNCQELWMRFLGQAATDPLLSVLVVSG